MFNATDFLNSTVSGPMSTSIPPVPEGEWRAMVDDSDKFVEFREVNTRNGPRPIATIWFSIVDDACRAQLGRDTVRIKHDIWLDLTPSGSIDTGEGKNVKLGQLRAALGQNDGSWSFGQLRGAGPVIVKTVQRQNEKLQPDDGKHAKREPSTPFSEVERVFRPI